MRVSEPVVHRYTNTMDVAVIFNKYRGTGINTSAKYNGTSKLAVIHMRMLAYVVTLTMHSYNIFLMNNILEHPVMEDPYIRAFSSLYIRFFTVWTMILQMFVYALGLATDYLTLKYSKKKEPEWLGHMRNFKNRIFAAVLWPTVFLVSTLFWSLYNYDRSLIYPLFADKILSSTSNHILHTAVIPLVVWEVVFQPRAVPQSHTGNVAMLAVYMITYLSIMYYTYVDLGIWLYPVFGLAYDTPFCFPLIMAFIGVMLIIYYHMQWLITAMVWPQDKLKKVNFQVIGSIARISKIATRVIEELSGSLPYYEETPPASFVQCLRV